MIRTQEQHLAHYGILRKSGRYPWGSGETEGQRSRDFLSLEQELRRQGLSESERAKQLGFESTTALRATKTIARERATLDTIRQIQRYKDRGWSQNAIANRMGMNESSVRHYLSIAEKDRANVLQSVANKLRDEVDQKGMIEVGKGNEAYLGITRNKLQTSLAMLKQEGYNVHTLKDVQLGTGKYTTSLVLTKPDISLQHVQRNRADIQLLSGYSQDGGRSFLKIEPPISVSSRRVHINYKEDGGGALDGVIFVRPGVKDLSLGNNSYGQVRIMIDKTHYLKGMAVHKEGLPDGVDLVFNTNKSSTGRKKDAMKEIEADPDNPFGSIIHQVHGPNGKVISAMNIVGSPTKPESGLEGSWDNWTKSLSSQMLSKQDTKLARQQLNMSMERRLTEYNRIKSLTNPTIRKDLLLKFGDETDSAAVQLKAAALPRQANRVILPVSSMKPTEIYAPTFRNGERVVLIRHPHGGTFEIPELTVNNRNPEALKLMPPGPRMDAVGIHHSVAQHLSGADFDGDNVLVIPNNKRLVKTTPALDELKNFDPHAYKIPEGSSIPRVDGSRKQKEMGKISNLITDMSLHGAETHEIARAVKHSMVVIDSEKHGLDIKASERDHGILALKEQYQGGKNRGASTLISRAKSDKRVEDRQERRASRGGAIDPTTGKRVYEPTGRMVRDKKTGELVPKLLKSTKLAETDDAFSLIDPPGTRMEEIYANHSNRLKALANTSRKESLQIKSIPYSPSAKKHYSNEVESLNAKLRNAERNAPLERQAQRLAYARYNMKRRANPDMDRDDLKKLRQIELNEARVRTGAAKHRIDIEQNEWDAIQAGAISKDKLERILTNTDTDRIKDLALPKQQPKMTATKIAQAERYAELGYTQIEIADHLGVGVTTLKEGLKSG